MRERDDGFGKRKENLSGAPPAKYVGRNEWQDGAKAKGTSGKSFPSSKASQNIRKKAGRTRVSLLSLSPLI